MTLIKRVCVVFVLMALTGFVPALVHGAAAQTPPPVAQQALSLIHI